MSATAQHSLRALPLTSIDRFLSWQPDQLPGDHARARCRTLLAKAIRDGEPRLLVCHDLEGGYGDDSLLAGGQDPVQYGLNAWHLVDIFVYFSHNLITLPPPGWTHAAHLHGVPVLGTFITEWETGKRICEELFGSSASAEQAASQLVALAHFFCFEGWLINIENELDVSKVPHLIHFVRTLCELMHQANPDAQVIWYDAVTVEGQLRWQDSLTPMNQPFFDACDGLFVNYTWKATTPQHAARAAGERAKDVYMGVDVFGRNTFGGGGFNSGLAVSAAQRHGLSSALFAPGWVWEVASPQSEWRQRSVRLWDSLHAVICMHRQPRPTVVSLPFSSSFNQGCGNADYFQGIVQSSQPWYNLGRQDTQPLFQEVVALNVSVQASQEDASDFQHQARIRLTWLQARVINTSAFDGGSVLRLEGQLEPGQPAQLALFSSAISIQEGGLDASLVIRMPLPGCSVNLMLTTQSQAIATGEQQASIASQPDNVYQDQAVLAELGQEALKADQGISCVARYLAVSCNSDTEQADTQLSSGATGTASQANSGRGQKVQLGRAGLQEAAAAEPMLAKLGVPRQWPGGWKEFQRRASIPAGTHVDSIQLLCSTSRADGHFEADIGKVMLKAAEWADGRHVTT